ncbi:hypothetical protein HMPREF1548_02096 [Clostridium sp. KLE 1755]|nr:hypothetical protein HMPREF1548_02096 [Clostridium sp. KLE 1755]
MCIYLGLLKHWFCTGANSPLQFSRRGRRKSYYNRGFPLTTNHTGKDC